MCVYFVIYIEFFSLLFVCQYQLSD